MMKRFKKYIERKGLVLSPDKSKVMVFEREKGRTRKREWKWGEGGRGEGITILGIYYAEEWRS